MWRSSCVIQQGKDQKAVQADKESSVIYWKADNIKPSWLRSTRKSTGEQEWGRNVFQAYRVTWLEHKVTQHWQSGSERDGMGRLYSILHGWWNGKWKQVEVRVSWESMRATGGWMENGSAWKWIETGTENWNWNKTETDIVTAAAENA